MTFATAGTRRKIASLGSLASAVFLIAGPASPAQADQVKRSLKPAHESARTVVFDLDQVRTSTVVNARVTLGASDRSLKRWVERQAGPAAAALREARERLESTLSASKVGALASRSDSLRVHKPTFASGGRLEVKLEQTPDPGPASLCAFDPATMTASGCNATINDTASVADPVSIWGKTDCETASRHQLMGSGGDPHPAAIGGSQGNDAFRRLTVFDGDDVWGERCELGLNSQSSGPTAIFKEGQRWITAASLRLPSDSYPLDANMWQVVMQMKQTQPAVNGGGTPVISLNARNGEWRLLQSNSAGASSDSHVAWSAQAASGAWTRFAFDITYSQDPTKGSIRVYADLNGDGDALDADEQSPLINTYTLKYETAGGVANSAVAPGESIPSHLRFGIYHDTEVACPTGCSVDMDNVQVVRAG